MVETLKLAAEEIAASRFNAPVMAIAPKPPLATPPTISLNSTSLVPTTKPKSLASELSELTVPLKVILLFVVVRIASPATITSPL